MNQGALISALTVAAPLSHCAHIGAIFQCHLHHLTGPGSSPSPGIAVRQLGLGLCRSIAMIGGHNN